LLAEGLARDVIRGIQESRREAGLAISDRIRLTLGAASVSAATALRAHQDLIARETLACELSIEALPEAEQEPSGTSAANMGAEWSARNVDLGADGLVAIALRRAG